MKQNVLLLKEKFDIDVKKRKLDNSNIENFQLMDDKDKPTEELSMVTNKVTINSYLYLKVKIIRRWHKNIKNE